MKKLCFSPVSWMLIILLLSTEIIVSSCHEDTHPMEQQTEPEITPSWLETFCQELNHNLHAVKVIADAQFQQEQVTNITSLEKDGRTIGYSLTFDQSGKIDIFHHPQEMPSKNTYAPALGLKEENGHFYWTLHGKWLLRNNQKVQANHTGSTEKDGIIPKLKIQGGKWYISYNDGLAWEADPIGWLTGSPSIASQAPGSLFGEIMHDDQWIYLTFSDKTTSLVLPKYQKPEKPQEQPPSFVNNTVWTYGLTNIPPTDTWKVVDTYGYTRYGLQWEEGYGWYDCNKEDPNGDKDSKLCWAAAASNMIHWWLRCHKDHIARYGLYHGPMGYTTSTDEEVFKFFKSAFYNNGNPVHYGVNWFFTGLDQFEGEFNKPQHEITAGFLADILGKNEALCDYQQYPSASQLTEIIKEAFSQQKCISLVHNLVGIPHAINLWGADFDQQGHITNLYLTDNNDPELEYNTAPKTPAGLLKRPVQEVNGKMCMANWQGICNIEIQGITCLGLMNDRWETYFTTHP